MDIKLVKKLFEEGVLTAAKIVPAPMQSNRFLLVMVRNSGAEEFLTKARDGEMKIYKRETGALADAREIGFKKIMMQYE